MAQGNVVKVGKAAMGVITRLERENRKLRAALKYVRDCMRQGHGSAESETAALNRIADALKD